MSLITCCPACATMFKVVPDQLKISEGWVRCGHCAEVFDAAAHLQQYTPTVFRPPAAQDEAQSQGLAPADDAAHAPPAPDTTAETNPPYPPFVLVREDSDAGETLPPPSGYDVFAPAPPVPAVAPTRQAVAVVEPQPEPALSDVSFVRQARRKAYWRRPGVRALLALLLLALCASLAAQFGVHDRDRLAATQPALRPLLQELCRHLQCAIAAPRQIEAIVIDSSSFNKLRSDAYRLNFTLKNQAAMELAMPSIELTLTDTQDQPVVRRVLAPAELGAQAGVIAAAAEWSGSLTMSVAANGSAGRIAGYRLLAFYP